MPTQKQAEKEKNLMVLHNKRRKKLIVKTFNSTDVRSFTELEAFARQIEHAYQDYLEQLKGIYGKY